MFSFLERFFNLNSSSPSPIMTNSNLEYLFDLSQNCDSAMFDYNRYAKVDNTTVMSYGCSWKKDL